LLRVHRKARGGGLVPFWGGNAEVPDVALTGKDGGKSPVERSSSAAMREALCRAIRAGAL
jgi:hypothetical protein